MKLEVLGHILDEEQTTAALTNHTNSIIIAGAGSGKSLTMVGKIKYLVQLEHVPLENILCITFTNAAALSLQEKIKKELNMENKVYTFHKLALEILKDQEINYKIAQSDLLEYLANEIFYAIGNEKYFKTYFLNKNYLESDEFINYKNTIIKFIRLFISKYQKDEWEIILNSARKKDIPFLMITKKIYEMYMLEKESNKEIDFDDMIILATNIVKKKGIKKKYQYIIIDEYQDTSNIRENLVKEIQEKTHAYITVVGDDFQSIYRFSGCDIDNFLEFKNHFYPAKKLLITNTYRNSNELIKVAGSFIMKNNHQIKKDLTSNKSIEKPIVIFYYQNEKRDFLKAIHFINSKNIMILGRNNKDILKVLSSKLKLENNKLYYEDKILDYMTIHKSKGLEAENVIIINLTDDVNSLPSKIPEEKVLKYVTKKDIYPYEEERRLFYVAITRTKNYCYLFVPKKNSSIFIKELKKDYKKYIKVIYL